MDVVGRKIENQVQFWSLLGPFFILLSIAVLLFKASPHWYFPLSALIGIPLCVKWKMKGMAVALTCLLFLSGVAYQNLELNDRYWHVGLAMAMAFSFIVLTLSLEEVQGVIGKLALESQSRLDNFLLLDDKLKEAELSWLGEKEKLKSELSSLTYESHRVLEDKQTFYKLAQLAKDELLQLRSQHGLLLQELLYKKHQIAQLNERVDESDATIQSFVNTDAEKKISSLKEQLARLEQEKEELITKIALSYEENQWISQESQACQIEREKMKRELLESEREKHHLTQVINENCVNLNFKIQEFKVREEQAKNQMEQVQQKLFEFEHVHEELLKRLKIAEQEKSEFSEKLNHQKIQWEHDQQEFHVKESEWKDQLHCIQHQLDREKANAWTTINELKQERLLLESKYQQLDRQYQQSDYSLRQTRQELMEKERILNHLEQDVEKLKQELLKREHDQQEFEVKESEWKDQLHCIQHQLEREKANAGTTINALKQERLLIESKHQQIDWQYQQSDYSLRQTRQELMEKERILNQLEQDVEKLKQELLKSDQTFQVVAEEKERLTNSNSELEKTLQQMEVKLFSVEQVVMAKNKKRDNLPYAPGNHRQIEAMYIQLKNQFQEKCQVLDETRRELFHAQECILNWQKNDEEEQIFGLSSSEKLLQQFSLKMGRYYERIHQHDLQEIDELTQLVAQLLRAS